jgi:hypothetical protein
MNNEAKHTPLERGKIFLTRAMEVIKDYCEFDKPDDWCADAYELLTQAKENIDRSKSIQIQLFDSLKEVISWRGSEDMMPPEIRGAWIRARAAIARAEGKE